MSFRETRNSYRAFSLVEIMIVIVIIGLLAGVVTVNVRSYLTKAKQNVARQDIAVIVSSLDQFWAETGRYPSNEEGLGVLTQSTGNFAEPLIKRSDGLLDPWGNPYQYTSPGPVGPYEVSSLGADGQEGGDAVNGDISSDNLKK